MNQPKLERGPMVGRMLEGDFEKDTITFHMPATYYLANGRYIIEPESDWLRRKEQLASLSAGASGGGDGRLDPNAFFWLGRVLSRCGDKLSPSAMAIISDRISATPASPATGQPQQASAHGDGEAFGWWIECHGTDDDFGQFVRDPKFVETLRAHGVVKSVTPLFTHPTPAALDAEKRCECCNTHEVELTLTCHNSACERYAAEVSVHRGWEQAAMSLPAQGENE